MFPARVYSSILWRSFSVRCPQASLCRSAFLSFLLVLALPPVLLRLGLPLFGWVDLSVDPGHGRLSGDFPSHCGRCRTGRDVELGRCASRTLPADIETLDRARPLTSALSAASAERHPDARLDDPKRAAR